MSKNLSIIERFEEKYIPEPNSGCWLWVGAISDNRYGSFWDGTRNVKAHRFIYEFLNGPLIFEALDHKCKNTLCVNPIHLEDVTHKINCQRRNEELREKIFCNNNHDLRLHGAFRNKGDRIGQRYCKECNRERSSRNKNGK